MNYNKIQKDFKNLEKDTKNLINQYNKTVDTIKSQELAIEKVKNKLNELVSGNKTPTSIRNLQTELKKTEQDVSGLEKEYNKAISEMSKKNIDLDWARNNGNVEEQNIIQGDINILDTKMVDLATKLENTRDKAERLKNNLNDAKLNPGNTSEVKELTEQINLMNSKLSETKSKAKTLGEEIKDNLNDTSMIKFGTGISDVGNKIDKFKNKMSRLISTAMVFSLMRNYLTNLRNGFIGLLKQNDAFSGSLNQIRANLMTAFAPIYNACLPAINSLMNALSKVTGTIAIFVANLFGTSIEDATAQASALSESLKDTAKSGKKASGTLASFDNLEVVQDSSASSNGGSGNKNTIDYSGELQYSQSLLDFLNKIKTIVIENKELFIGLGIAIAGAFILNKLTGFLSNFKSLGTMIGTISKLFVKVGKDGTKSFNNVGTGITVALAGFVLMAKNVVDLITKWDELDEKQKIIKLGMAALGTAAIALGYAIAAGFSAATLGIGAIIAVIVAAVTALATLIAKWVTEKDAILSVEDAQKRLTEAQNAYIEANDNYINAVDKSESALKKLEDIEKKTGLSGAELNQQVENGILNYADMTESQREVYKAYLENLSTQDELTASTKALSEAKKQETMASFANQLAIAAETGNYDDYKNSVVKAYEEGKISAEEARDLIEQSMSRMSDSSQKTFMEDLPNDIKNGMDPDKYQTAGQKLKNWFGTLFTETIPEKLSKLGEILKKFFTKTLPNLAIAGVETLVNKIITAFESLINLPIKGINKFIKTANKIPGVEIGTLNTVSLGRVSIPRLAQGTVIPPRQEFLAMLGDQKHGTNIEAPLETIKQANREVLEEFMGSLNGLNNEEKEIVLKNLTIIAQFGNKTFQKLVIDSIRLSEKEMGKPLLVS